jgi:hypothetical protein
MAKPLLSDALWERVRPQLPPPPKPNGLRQATLYAFALSRRSVGGAGPQRFTKTDLAIPGGIPVL